MTAISNSFLTLSKDPNVVLRMVNRVLLLKAGRDLLQEHMAHWGGY